MTPLVLVRVMELLVALVRALFTDRADLAIENLALRQPLGKLGPGRSLH